MAHGPKRIRPTIDALRSTPGSTPVPQARSAANPVQMSHDDTISQAWT